MKYARIDLLPLITAILLLVLAQPSKASDNATSVGDVPVNLKEPGSPCGPAQNTYGPFDYRTAHRNQKNIVESAHFTPMVEALRGGQTGGSAGGDIYYTLSVFPNHHRALVAVDRLADKEKTDPPKRAGLKVECWYIRAIRWVNDDLIVRLLYADFLVRQNRVPDALSQIDYAVERADGNPFTHYNAGLVYMSAKAYGRALAQAHKAIELGMTQDNLKRQLQDAGQWREPDVRPVTGVVGDPILLAPIR